MKARKANRTGVPAVQVNYQVTFTGLGRMARVRGPVTHRHTVSVKHRLVLRLLQLQADEILLAAGHAHTHSGTGAVFSGGCTLCGTTRTKGPYVG